MASVHTAGDILTNLVKAGKVNQILTELNAEILSSPRAANSETHEDEPQRR